MKKLFWKVLAIVFMAWAIVCFAWFSYVKWGFANGLDIAYVYRQLASQLMVATSCWILSTVFHYLDGNRRTVWEVLQTVATGCFAVGYTLYMISISISYYGNWFTLKWYPLWWTGKPFLARGLSFLYFIIAFPIHL